MSIQKYLDEMKKIQDSLLAFLDDTTNTEGNYQELISLLNNNKICDDKHKLRSILNMILNISNFHHRGPFFFNKIDRILNFFKDYIKNYYSEKDIFNIFKNNKRILLFFVENKLLTIDKYIFKKIFVYRYYQTSYHKYFLPEFKALMNEEWVYEHQKKDLDRELPDNFYDLRKIGEDEKNISELIRNDSFEKFSEIVSKHKYLLFEIIEPSIYENNGLLLKKVLDYKDEFRKEYQITAIQYAALSGSIHIFQYMVKNDVKLTPSLWPFAIHGRNMDIIHILEENKIQPEDPSYKQCLIESIKCHHDEIANYIIKKYFKDDFENLHEIFIKCAKYYNFSFIPNEIVNEKSFYTFCKHGFYNIADCLLKEKDINVNKII